MTDLKNRLAKLSPEQQRLLEARLKKTTVAAQKPASGAAFEASDEAANVPLAQSMAFSMLFFSGDGTREGGGKYDFLMECARFADQSGFSGVWVPERHFQTFGGLFPNPSVLGAALAMTTEKIQIRAGSVVMPLHHPIRIAEEWSMVDNLSNGRVGVSMATGWSRGDFTLAPDSFEDRRKIAFDALGTLQQLWSGETVTFDGVDGAPFDVTILPRPIQKTLPIWVTVSGNPETWVKAGEVGANVLTAMIGAPEDLAPHIARYRTARAEAGHDPAAGCVSVMMHSFIDAEEEVVRDCVREPLCKYLEKFIAQDEILEAGGQKIDPDALTDRDRREMTLIAFERYVRQSGLLGTPEKCARMVDRMAAIGVDEIACLVDFGVEPARITEALPHLAQLCADYAPTTGAETEATA